MGRNLYILAATLGVFALISFGLSFTHLAHEPASPGDTSLWRMTGLVLLCAGLIVGLLGTLSDLFEQAERRATEQRLKQRKR